MAKNGRLELRTIFTDSISLYSTTATYLASKDGRKESDRETYTQVIVSCEAKNCTVYFCNSFVKNFAYHDNFGKLILQ